ncbi:DcaP family trimeric outer membrane transporter [Inmirania thermothiophila]|uniref:DcaP family trimeric outer membrane transporter n=1 Tax=Inmirania thermothiophila TaxID=1750597 RepID=UPI000F47C459|nr:DcaP family trimeric outer membrane transporter [Inmirania thermothiophila]
MLGVFRQLRNEGTKDETETAFWGAVGGRINVGGGKDNLRFEINGGDGIGRYASLALSPDAVLRADGTLSAVSSVQGFVAYQHWWTPTVRSNLVYGIADIDQETGLADTEEETVQSVHLNLMWSPQKNVRYGIEYLYGKRELFNGDEGELNRLQFSGRYVF